MSHNPPTRRMRENPDIDQLKRQAKELLEAYRLQEPESVAEVHFYHLNASPETFALHDAQFVLARSYGFESWPKLKAAVDGATASQLHAAVEAGDLQGARALLTRRPEIVDRGRGSEMRALHMAVLRRDLAMTQLLLEFGADPEGGIYPNRDATSPYVIARDRDYSEILEPIQQALIRRGFRGPARPSESMRKLGEAFRTGDEDAVIAVFDQHPELADICPADGPSMLHQMAGHGSLKMIRWMVMHGHDMNRKWHRPWWNHEWTPLDFAASSQASIEPLDFAKFEATAICLLDLGAQLTPLSAATLGRWDYLERFSRQDLEGHGVLEGAVRGNHLDVLRRLLDLGLDPNERMQVGSIADQSWSAGGPLFHAVILDRIDLARLLLVRGADPNIGYWAAGSPTFRAYELRNPAMIDLIEKYGGRLDPGSAAYARQVELSRKMLAGEIDAPFEPNDFSGHTVAEQLLWGGASSLSPEIVRMALERIDWPSDDPRWFWMLWRPVPGHDDYNKQQQADCCETFRLILDRCGPDHRAKDGGQTMLHEVVARDHGVGKQLASILLARGARLDLRDNFLKSTPLGWACRWGRPELVQLFLVRGADPIERDAEPWATPRAWAEKMRRPEITELLNQAISSEAESAESSPT